MSKELLRAAKRMPAQGGGRKMRHPEMESELYDWIMNLRESKLRVTRKAIQRKALRIVARNGMDPDFKATIGLLFRFLTRHRLSLRRRTTICQKTGADLLDNLVSFVKFVRRKRTANGYDQGAIRNADQTAVWLDPVGNTTVDAVGVKDVALKTTGHEKARITVMLSATADGRKDPPFVLIDKKRPIKDLQSEFAGKLTIRYSEKTWFNAELVEEWLRVTYARCSFFGKMKKQLLVWDSFKGHISGQARGALKELNVDPVVVPNGCTKYLQPADVSWNKAFKDAMTEQYDQWMVSGEHQRTRGGNLKPAPYSEVCKWIFNAWKSLDSDLIASSFKFCGVTNAIDGSEDHLIKVFQKEECKDGLGLLNVQSAADIEQHDESEYPVDSDVEDVPPAFCYKEAEVVEKLVDHIANIDL